jgi:FMN phosphatase YigB (HAD superfamily)
MLNRHLIILCTLIFSATALFGRTIIFDIHGVLLHEDIDRYVKHKKHMAELEHELNSETPKAPVVRGNVQDNDMFRTLCKLMMKHAPLGPPTEKFMEYVAVQMSLPKDKRKLIPFETYQLFCGAVPPKEMHPKITAMVDTVTFDEEDAEDDAEKRRDMHAFVDTIFNREELVRATMIVINEGVKILKQLASNPENTIVVYSNAPHEWVEMYSTVFPEVFGESGLIPQANILSSGLKGHLKPLEEAFTAVREHLDIAAEETVYLVDDSPSNIEGSAGFNITGIQFSHKKTQECIAELLKHEIISEEEAATLGLATAADRTSHEFGYEVGFF